MNNRDYRELQLTSTQLIFIFVAILILGLVIFLLGVSVGKKQAMLVAEAGVSPEEKPAINVEEKKPQEIVKREETAKTRIDSELKSFEKAQPEPKTSKSITRNLYYVQIGAFSNKDNALKLADQYRKKGYPVRVTEPSPTSRRKFYKVWIGGYKTRAEAEKIKTKLTQESKTGERFLVVRD
ncbi:MAG: SPOR domain-containing protein [Candidatus Aminicenantales bacterium]